MKFVEFCEAIGVKLEPGQRVLTSVCFDGVQPGDLAGDDREIARQLFGETEQVPPEVLAVIVWVCGARAGKSYLSSLRLLHLALTAPLDTLAPGEVASATIVAPDLKLGKQELRFALGAARSTPAIARLITSEGAESFTLTREKGRSVVFECLAASVGGRALRGRSLVGALMSEACFFRAEDGYEINDAEIYRALAPRLLPGAQLVMASTPWAENGLIYDMWRENFGIGTPKTALVAHAPTLLLLPTARNRFVVAAEERRDPENAAREFGAQFMTAGTGLFFDPSMVDAMFDDDEVNDAA